ncbi:hypothetical protein RBWH47_03641 [Rhodopirellula baltica WH47]|uniref:Uncharacterized protein n=1 Tax=Rhodopirellula baltica WH47 TaxID=991778 RepID=F2B0G1_RHOBT|nr:hypothetical protein RBWH47_03641 [Rhodopirellula baltica WH47]
MAALGLGVNPRVADSLSGSRSFAGVWAAGWDSAASGVVGTDDVMAGADSATWFAADEYAAGGAGASSNPLNSIWSSSFCLGRGRDLAMGIAKRVARRREEHVGLGSREHTAIDRNRAVWMAKSTG